MKALINSRAFWLAAAQFLVGFLALFTASFGQYIPAGILGLLAMAKSCIDIYLRMNTTTQIGGVLKP